MSFITDFLGLFCYQPTIDKKRTFNITQSMTENFVKLDEFAQETNSKLLTPDNTTINRSSANKMQSVGVIDQNAGGALKAWKGNAAQFNAIVTKDSNTLYYVVDAGQVYCGNTLISNNYSQNFGAIVTSILPLTDAGLHLADGGLLYKDGIYDETVDKIAQLYAENPNANYFCTEAQWQSSVNTYGVCGKFVYDSENNTVRLPKLTGIIEGTTDINALGDLVEAGLPNIKGTFGGTDGDKGGTSQYSGAFYNTNRYYGSTTSASSDDNPITGFNASRSSSIYGNSTTVQPQTIKCFVYIVIANSTKTEIQSDIDSIVTDLNGKADVDLTNINNVGYIKMAGAGMPSNKYINLTIGADGTTYTAPANGWYNFRGDRKNGTSGYVAFAIHNRTTGMSATTTLVNDYEAAGLIIPANKNDIIRIEYQKNISPSSLKFFYAVGSESEAS